MGPARADQNDNSAGSRPEDCLPSLYDQFPGDRKWLAGSPGFGGAKQACDHRAPLRNGRQAGSEIVAAPVTSQVLSVSAHFDRADFFRAFVEHESGKFAGILDRDTAEMIHDRLPFLDLLDGSAFCLRDNAVRIHRA